jgi:hypothetical protein
VTCRLAVPFNDSDAIEQSVLDAAAETPIYVKALDEMKGIIHNA